LPNNIKNSLKTNSKSFYFASLFLNKKTAYYCYVLYKFCRTVDDIADTETSSKKKKLNELIFFLKSENKPKQIFLIEIKKLINKKIINREPLIELIKGVLTDTRHVHIQNTSQLINYSYLVAGSVGIMMCQLLNNTNLYSFKYAVDLGIAMQLTNILRDIIEDAKINRVYLPNSWIKIKPSKIIKQDKKIKKKLMSASRKLFFLSEKYYNSAYLGLAFLPIRSRFAILLALITYRQIGRKIIRKKYSNLNKREIISSVEKIKCLTVAIFIFLINFKIHFKVFNHNKKLHETINKNSFLFKLKV
jgi:phytoene synthase